MVSDFRRRFWISLAITVPILILSPGVQRIFNVEETLRFRGQSYFLFALASAVYFYGGWPFLTGMIRELRKLRTGMMTLVALAISIAYIYSSAVVFGLEGDVLFWELATLIDIMLLGHWLEMRSVMGASGALQKLAELLPKQAHRLGAAGEIEDVPLESLHEGDRVLVRPGEKIPVDGKIVKGETSVDLSLLTGESKPLRKGVDDQLIGGSINGEGAVQMVIEKTGADTYLSQVIETVRRAQESRSRSQDLADRAAFVLTLIAIIGGAATLATWLALGYTFEFGITRSVAVMVIACPHALGLAIPLVVSVSTTIAASRGFLIRDRSAFERARLIEVVVFDKTGTLTKGSFGVMNVLSLDDEKNEDGILQLMAAVESGSEHTIARAIVNEAQSRGLNIEASENFSAIPGRGAKARVRGREIVVASPGYVRELGSQISNAGVEQARERGETVVYLLEEDKPIGAVALADVVREESMEAVRDLRAAGIRCMMITGDSKTVAQRVSEELGLADFFAEVLPQEKSQRIKELQERGLVVAMVGDGINDAPALVQADVGIAIGAGTDVAIESADIVLARNDPRDVVQIIGLGKITYRKMVQNLGWATGYNFFAIPLAAGVLYPVGVTLSPAIGAVLMSLSTIIVAFNARWLKP
ncbi:MAG: ATPase, partial [Actinobacteria bacterium RBG_19FT_COMBO_54_7]